MITNHDISHQANSSSLLLLPAPTILIITLLSKNLGPCRRWSSGLHTEDGRDTSLRNASSHLQEHTSQPRSLQLNLHRHGNLACQSQSPCYCRTVQIVFHTHTVQHTESTSYALVSLVSLPAAVHCSTASGGNKLVVTDTCTGLKLWNSQTLRFFIIRRP